MTMMVYVSGEKEVTNQKNRRVETVKMDLVRSEAPEKRTA